MFASLLSKMRKCPFRAAALFLYLAQIIYCSYWGGVPLYSDECAPYRLEVYREVTWTEYLPYIGHLFLIVSDDQIVLLKRENLQREQSWELRVDTGERVINWEGTYLCIVNRGERNQEIHVMEPDSTHVYPDESILSASDYIYHNI